ncbi:hypothetical protein DPMN_099523 [Dreissena polymorpha]|uniref:Uncharacterized protein n=1 Tax=Dreissena polymorpha TaxID=45954 RepID=A0A9D4LE98_DREPO|nr:hypothetical protein DPMN_099523 [Dreissena polymorpha]
MPSGHLPETPGQSATLSENPPDRRGTRRRLMDSLRRCQYLCAAEGDSQAVPGVSETVRAPSEKFHTVCDGTKTVWAPAVYLKIVCYGANTVSAPAGDFQTVFYGRDSLSDRRGTLSRPRDSLRRCQTVSHTGGAPAGNFQTVCDGVNTVRTHTGDSQTVCDGARQFSRPVGHMQETPIHSTTCQYRLGNFRRLPDSL